VSKSKSVFVCQGCGYNSPKWLGKCPGCGEWSTLVEEIEEQVSSSNRSLPPTEPVLYSEIETTERARTATGILELDQVLGGGAVPGSLVLIGGEPGIGKSTLLLQASRELSQLGHRVLYVSGEESLEQIKLRGERLGVKGGNLFLLAETNLERIISQSDILKPEFLIIDSVQTMFSSQLSSTPGTISQVREVANRIFRYAKSSGVCSFLVGHITKEGSLAGPKSLEHVVDVVLYFEGERDHSHRVLRAFKNRFGPVSELAIFEMAADGLRPISNPSAFFLKERPMDATGSVVVCTIKGSRPFLAEIQALVSSTLFTGNPRRMSIGLSHIRTGLLLAVVEAKLGYSFGGDDIHLNVAGGLRIDEPASDLGVLAAVISCLKNKVIPPNMVVLGEIGLSGEVRSISQPVVRIKEAVSMGFKSVLLPKGNLDSLRKEQLEGVDLFGVSSIKEAMGILF
jgi:DNA repair protein RadA/Sms